jgi:hypothetical protein
MILGQVVTYTSVLGSYINTASSSLNSNHFYALDHRGMMILQVSIGFWARGIIGHLDIEMVQPMNLKARIGMKPRRFSR